MTLLAIGVTHHSAPLNVLDELSIDPAAAGTLAADAVRSCYVSEALVLATCNRLELIADVSAFHASTQDLADLLAKAMGTTKHELLPHLHISYGEQAARHIFEVASGMDSLVVGEQQIIGQVRGALAAAQESGTAARRLNGVTQAALRCAKRIHSQTGIDRHGASVVSVGLDAAAEHLPMPWPQARVAVVGAGAMASLALTTLLDHGVTTFTVVNRTPERAASVAVTAGARVASLTDLPSIAAQVDIVVTCTGSTDLILRAADVAQARSGATAPLTVLDLAMPHDSDPGLSQLPGVTRIALGDLVSRPETEANDEDVASARRILEAELAQYIADDARRRLDPLVVSLRARAGEHVAAEADRIRARLPHLSHQDLAEIENALRRTANSLLHTPTVRVKQLAGDPDGRRFADALHSLFDLPAAAVEALGTPEGTEDEGWW